MSDMTFTVPIHMHNQVISKNRELKARIEKLEGALREIEAWATAYPVEVFPEPDFKQVRELLGANLLSQVSASNMRHVIEGVKRIVETALD